MVLGPAGAVAHGYSPRLLQYCLSFGEVKDGVVGLDLDVDGEGDAVVELVVGLLFLVGVGRHVRPRRFSGFKP